MSDARNPKAGGLWARLFRLTAEPEEAAPPEKDANAPAQSEAPANGDEAVGAPALPTEEEDAAAPATMVKVKPAAPPDETESVALLETIVAPAAPATATPPAPAAPTACPSCGALRKPAAKFCDDCGWMFAADAGL